MVVPVVAIVDGVKIEFYPDEHPPPHFHARFAEFVAQIEIRTNKVLQQGLARLAASRQAQPCVILGRRAPIGVDECLDRGRGIAEAGEDK
jgi:Domain of unknown function (DUF4160)